MNRNIKCFIGVILLNYDLCKDKCNSQENGDKLRALKVKYFKFGIIKLTKLYKYLCSAEDTDSPPLLPAGVSRVWPDTGGVGHHLGQSQLLSTSFNPQLYPESQNLSYIFHYRHFWLRSIGAQETLIFVCLFVSSLSRAVNLHLSRSESTKSTQEVN